MVRHSLSCLRASTSTSLLPQDPHKVEMLLRMRGEYRPHADFGVNLSIPWQLGTQEDPSWEVASGSVYSTTRGIGGGWANGQDAERGDTTRKIGLSDGVTGGRAGGQHMMGDQSAAGMRITGGNIGGAFALVEEIRQVEQLSNELAVVEAPRTRELGLHQQHTLDYLAHYGDQALPDPHQPAPLAYHALLSFRTRVTSDPTSLQARLGANVSDRPWEAVALGHQLNKPKEERYVPPKVVPRPVISTTMVVSYPGSEASVRPVVCQGVCAVCCTREQRR